VPISGIKFSKDYYLSGLFVELIILLDLYLINEYFSKWGFRLLFSILRVYLDNIFICRLFKFKFDFFYIKKIIPFVPTKFFFSFLLLMISLRMWHYFM
jgi:hypothetical protein